MYRTYLQAPEQLIACTGACMPTLLVAPKLGLRVMNLHFAAPARLTGLHVAGESRSLTLFANPGTAASHGTVTILLIHSS